jgi:diguanylate cyclase (GGDEF)-like protein/PAS domain S-box-containing protein
MYPPRIPVNEGDRLMALHRLALLDTAPDESFDRITRLAAEALCVPILLLSLVDENRQWFKSRVGLDTGHIDRNISFCGHVLFDERPLVIHDARIDARFADNPLVTGAPCVRAYIGVPLRTLDGHTIGTLCAMDNQVRDFGAREVATLGEFARIVEGSIQATQIAAQSADALRLARDQERLFRDTFERAAVGIVHTLPSGRLLRVNQRACGMLGYSEAELQAVTFVDITHPDDVAPNTLLFQQLLAGTIDEYRMEKRFQRKDGQHLWTHLSVALRRTNSGEPDYVIAVIEDIAEKKRLEIQVIQSRDSLAAEVAAQTQTLQDRNLALRTQINRVLESERRHREAEHRLRSIADSVPAMIGYWNHELRCEFANEAYRAYFGLAPGKVVGITMNQLLGDDLFKLNVPYARMALAGHAQRFERILSDANGAKVITDARYVPDVDERGDVQGFFVLVTDITAMREVQTELEVANARLKVDSTTDYLTGLANRRVFADRSAQAAIAYQGSGELYGLILMDIDNFKAINDTYGHDEGDEVLRLLGKVLRDEPRGHKDLAARLGGEEFALLCVGELTEKSMYQLAERIRLQINQAAVHTPKGMIHVTCSFGMALGSTEDTDWKSIYARADAALYEAKIGGKDRIAYGRPGTTRDKGFTGRFRRLRLAPVG